MVDDVETAEYKDLKDKIAKKKAQGLTDEQVVAGKSDEVDKLDRELVDAQKEVLKAIEDYGKVSFGPGYLKKLEVRLSIIDKRLETNLSTPERKLLVQEKETIEKKIQSIPRSK